MQAVDGTLTVPQLMQSAPSCYPEADISTSPAGVPLILQNLKNSVSLVGIPKTNISQS